MILQKSGHKNNETIIQTSLIPGEAAAIKKLSIWVTQNMENYHQNRNYPFLQESGSNLSVYQTLGLISMRICWIAASIQKKSEGQTSWLNEIAWREFYRNVWYSFQHIREGESFKKEYDKIPWSIAASNYSENLTKNIKNTFIDELKMDVNVDFLYGDFKTLLSRLQAWIDGKTGYPLVDAGMRQLAKTGSLPNRLRMICASFLTKHLLIDWRIGERYFQIKLLDWDRPSNNGGWQWSASTGTDSQPYFRVFNPARQAVSYDPDAKYIKTWIPELKNVAVESIHEMQKLNVLSPSYPPPICDHSKCRALAISIFKSVVKP